MIQTTHILRPRGTEVVAVVHLSYNGWGAERLNDDLSVDLAMNCATMKQLFLVNERLLIGNGITLIEIF